MQTVGLALTGLPVAAQTQAAGPHTLWYREAGRQVGTRRPAGRQRQPRRDGVRRRAERAPAAQRTQPVVGPSAKTIDSPQTLEYLPKVRQLLFDGKYAEANQMAAREHDRAARTAPASYQTLGDLLLEFRHGDAADYRRELNLDTGIASVPYRAGGARLHARGVRVAARPGDRDASGVRSAGRAFLHRALSRPADAKVEYSARDGSRCAGRRRNDGVGLRVPGRGAQTRGGKLSAPGGESWWRAPTP